MPTWVPKRPEQRPWSRKDRLLGCKAYPTTGIIVGATAEWCRQAQGEWCGECKHRSNGSNDSNGN